MNNISPIAKTKINQSMVFTKYSNKGIAFNGPTPKFGSICAHTQAIFGTNNSLGL
jgi:hypothetical protein